MNGCVADRRSAESRSALDQSVRTSRVDLVWPEEQRSNDRRNQDQLSDTVRDVTVSHPMGRCIRAPPPTYGRSQAGGQPSAAGAGSRLGRTSLASVFVSWVVVLMIAELVTQGVVVAVSVKMTRRSIDSAGEDQSGRNCSTRSRCQPKRRRVAKSSRVVASLAMRSWGAIDFQAGNDGGARTRQGGPMDLVCEGVLGRGAW